MKRYEKYKDSGIDWLGDIPEHWNVSKIGHYARVSNGSTPNRNNADYWVNGNIPWLSSGKVNDSVIDQCSELITNRALEECSIRLYPKGSVVIGLVGQGKTRGTSSILGIEACINQNMAAIEPKDSLYSSFLHLFLISAYEIIRNYGEGGNQAALNCELVRSFKILIPPLEEQKTIARYLDRKTAEIDQLIAQKERLIELYEEEKIAIINQAVTKGINPDVKLKPSGIDWLGDIPEHCEVTALKRLVEKITDGEHISPKFATEGMPFLSAKDVRDGYVQMPDDKFVDYQDGLKFRKRCNPEFDDILLVSRGATVGRVAIINTDIVFCLLSSVILLKPKQNIYSQYLFYSLKNKLLQDNFLNSSQSSAQQAIYLVDVASVYLAIPPLKEQKAIARYIETECDRIDTKIAKTKRIIELQKEYRTALISEAVTGKIKVPQLT